MDICKRSKISMTKIAVCVSGKCNGDDILRYDQIRRQKFDGADFFYATWAEDEGKIKKLFPQNNIQIFKQPVIHYHPYWPTDGFESEFFLETRGWVEKNNKKEWSSHHTKQHLIHALLLSSIENIDQYDIIIRTRFDGFIWPNEKADFRPFIEDSAKHNRANCFAVTRKERFTELYESNHVETPKMKFWCLDQLIVHPPNLLNIDEVFLLSYEGRLRAAEFGWHQILSEPHGNNHRNMHGWVNHDKNVLSKFLR
jgi:hypothetical protein